MLQGSLHSSISIHAPTQGATHFYDRSCEKQEYFNPRPYARGDRARNWTFVLYPISIHAPTQGATIQHRDQMGQSTFQSTPLRKGRLRPYPLNTPPYRISIHAPTQGATHTGLFFASPNLYFNPRPYARGDLWCSPPVGGSIQFQSTPLRKGRHVKHFFGGGIVEISIHAPTQGATQLPLRNRGY